MDDIAIRPARSDELEDLPDIERRAARRFSAIGLADIAEGPPTEVAFLEAVARLGGVFVAANRSDDVPVGFILVGLFDRTAYIYELSVVDNHAGQGIGRRLIEEAGRLAGAEGANALTLSTFTDVPWNGPYYERLGFRYLTPDAWTPAMFLLHDSERRRGLPMERRAFMRWDFQ